MMLGKEMSREHRIMVITGILPVPDISHKKDENDILLVTEEEIQRYQNNFFFSYVFVLPRVGYLLSLVSSKWKSYYRVRRNRFVDVRGKKIPTLAIYSFPKFFPFRKYLYDLNFFLSRKRIRRIIETFRPTIIHAQSVHGSAYIARKISQKYGVPFVVTLRGVNKHVDSLVVNTLNSAKTLLAISPTQKQMTEAILSKEVFYIPHGVPDDFFVGEARVESVEGLRIITVCRLIKLKNIDKVIVALSKEKSKNYIYDIYGDGPEKDRLANLILELELSDRVFLRGRVENNILPGILVNYDVFVMPSLPESLGRVYFEAMACGLPVIAAKNTGIDGLIENSIHGYIVNVNEEEDLQCVISKIIIDPNLVRSMKTDVLSFIQDFRWKEVVNKYHDLYENTLKD